jgi:hypothetical protein
MAKAPLRLFLACCLAIAAPLPAQETTAVTEGSRVEVRRSDAGQGWSTQTRRREERRPVEPGESTLFLRVYDGDRVFGPVLDEEGQVLGLNVTTALETCADGNTIVKALNIGGWHYSLDVSCSDFSRGSRITLRREADGLVIRESANQRREAGVPRVIRCEPGRWTCRTEVAERD